MEIEDRIKEAIRQNLVSKEQVSALDTFMANNTLMANKNFISIMELVFDMGFEDGYTEGYSMGDEEGYRAGYDEGYSVGASVEE